MISYFDKIESLKNLRCGHAAGQVATLLILIITAVLIFTLIVANVGQVSNYATSLSNAADSASMLLASQIGTKAFQLSGSLYESCGNPTKCCVKTGFLALVLAIIIAIVAIVVTYITWGAGAGFLSWAGAHLAACIAAGAIGGAVGGAIGGAIAGTGAMQGAIQGAMVGAAIGAGISMGAAAGSSAFATEVPIVAPDGWMIAMGITSYMVPSAGGAIVGASLAVTLAISANIYAAYVKDQMLGDAMASAAKAMNGLPSEKTRRRETVFFQAFTETIDDPNKVRDTIDSDGDGNTSELVPNFQVCWDRRITWIKDNNKAKETEQTRLVRNFLRGANSPMQLFLAAIDAFLFAIDFENQWQCDCTFDDYGNCLDDYGNPQGCCVPSSFIPAEGGLIRLFDALERRAGFPIWFWEPGPTQAQLDAWADWDPFSCGGCPHTPGPCGTIWDPLTQCTACEPPDPPSGYDEVDYAKEDLIDFKEIASFILAMSDGDLAYSWELWVPWYYDPTGNDDYYDTLYLMVNGDNSSAPPRAGLRTWLTEIERIRQLLPICNYGTGGWYADEYGNLTFACVAPGPPCNNCIIPVIQPNGRPNPPCQWHPNNPNFGSIDTDIDDEFAIARNAINAFIDAIEAFRQASKRLYERLSALDQDIDPDSPMACGLFGGNPARYTWTDSRGEHSIMIMIDRYDEPRLKKRSYGNWLKGKKCIELDYHTQNVRVEMMRQDPQADMGILGQWNPHSQGMIRRTSVAQYRGLKSYDDKCRPAGWVRVVDR